MANVKPITPSEVVSKKATGMPDGVFEAFNELIAEGWDGSRSVVTQVAAMIRVLEKINSGKVEKDKTSRQDVFDNHWLDVEGIYRKNGWKVEYDKPAYNESYEAHFIFSKGKKKKVPCGEGC